MIIGLPLIDLRSLTEGDLPPTANEADWCALARRLRGQFAIVAQRGAATVCVTDPVGSYPVLVHDSGAVGLSLDDLAPLSNREISQTSLEELRTHGGFVGDRVGYADISRLPGASVTVVQGSRREIRSYIDWLELTTPEEMTENEAIERIEATATEYLLAVLRRGPGAVLLSGGTDSSLIALLLKRAGMEVDFLTADFRIKRYSEASEAEAISRDLGVSTRRELVGIRDFVQGFSRVNATCDAPCSNPAAPVFTALATRAAKRGVKFLITGDHADSLFLGFDHHAHLPDNWINLPTVEKLNYLPPGERGTFRTYAEQVDILTLLQLPGQMHGGIGWQHVMLPVERTAGVLLVSPFYDIAMIRLALSLPASLKCPSPRTKPLLRAALRRVLGRELVKRGSPSPARAWSGALPVLYNRMHPADRPTFAREYARWAATAGRSYGTLMRTAALGLWRAYHGAKPGPSAVIP